MEYAEWYTKASKPFSGQGAARAVRLLDGAIVAVFAVEYVATLCVMAWQCFCEALGVPSPAALLPFGVSFVGAVAVPLATLVIVSALRAALDKPRPYEAHDIQPILHQGSEKGRTKGKSFPSRHVACAVIIAVTMCLAWRSLPIAIVQVVLCAGMAFTRVIGGVHFPRDIAASLAVAALCALVGFALVP